MNHNPRRGSLLTESWGQQEPGERGGQEPSTFRCCFVKPDAVPVLLSASQTRTKTRCWRCRNQLLGFSLYSKCLLVSTADEKEVFTLAHPFFQQSKVGHVEFFCFSARPTSPVACDFEMWFLLDAFVEIMGASKLSFSSCSLGRFGLSEP